MQAARTLAPLLGAVAVAVDGNARRAGVETALAAGDIAAARQWAETAGLWHWLALVDVADPERRGRRLPSLGALEDMAARGRLDVETLHKLATVLDALDIDVPIAIWDAASRTPQPASGHLPETGILAELAEASKAQRRRPHHPARPARRRRPWPGSGQSAGARRCDPGVASASACEADARRLGLEALLPVWPRTPRN